MQPIDHTYRTLYSESLRLFDGAQRDRLRDGLADGVRTLAEDAARYELA